MYRKFTLSAALVVGALSGSIAMAEGEGHVHDYHFSFEGPFGAYDQDQLQRGLQVYTEVCSACHGLQYVALRTLADEGGVGWTMDNVRAYIDDRGIQVWDPTLFNGEGDYRPATPADKFPAVTGANAPDLSLMAKARAGFHGPYGTGLSQLFNGMGGPEYIASLLAGYEEEPECAAEAGMDGYYNTVFTSGGYPDSCKVFNEEGVEIDRLAPGSWIGMAPPLFDDQLVFGDESPADVEAMAQDVAAFLMWTAEPKMMARKQAGLTGVIFLTVLSVLLYLTNKRLWAPHKKAAKEAMKSKS